MAADATTTGEQPSYHRLSAAGLRDLAHGEGDGAVMAELLRAERSRRLLLLRALRGGVLGDGVGPDGVDFFAQGWDLLERAQCHAPEACEELLMSPNTGMWVSLAVRRVRGRVYEDAPHWVVLGHLAALAAAAAARAGMDFDIAVPVRRGRVQLPTLGCAALTDREPWGAARVTGRDGRVRITGAGGEVAVPAGPDRRDRDWTPVRRMTLGTGSRAKPLVLEELDPYRTFPRPSGPSPLPPAEAAYWESSLAAAWDVLLRDEPGTAEAMRRGLISVAPTPARERFRPHSSTAGDAFGGVTASRPDDVAQLAATLVHEFQHTKLGGLMHLEPLTGPPADPEEPETLFYAPWRDDPRPLGGLLQGIYAFLGVTRFWRAHRHTADPAYVSLAHFEFALWRGQVWATLTAVHGHERLTPLGRYVVERLTERCAAWLTDEVPATPLRLAQEAAADHHARWRAHHLRPPAEAVEESVRAWRQGAPRPPAALAAEPLLVPDAEAGFSDSTAVLARYHLSEPDGPWQRPGAVDGAETAEVRLILGEHTEARDAFIARLSDKEAPVSAWPGLGRSLAAEPARRAAADLLLQHPERARAVQDAIAVATGRRADPVRLAAWLGA
ncbi:HEXXH motif domain-containing protein [Streptomyces malaysiense]|uniref:HEXXH motif domain-containing protein n=1 Tax=Streptomyces malaysiense TaxID=1428626 RepID=UPI0006214844|nr:HEXXH motif domain-containing protein [Streptomyces malaysiense]